jgi:Fe-S-cluster-containing hydrogenase component 2
MVKAPKGGKCIGCANCSQIVCPLAALTAKMQKATCRYMGETSTTAKYHPISKFGPKPIPAKMINFDFTHNITKSMFGHIPQQTCN